MSSNSTPAKAPINQVVPTVSQSASFVFASTLVLVRGLYVTVSRLASLVLVLSPIPAILYVIAPALVFCQLAFGLFFLSPYALAVYVLEVLYPLYVFVGVACITGVLVGVGGRFLAGIVTAFVLQISEEREERVTGKGVVEEKSRMLKVTAT